MCLNGELPLRAKFRRGVGSAFRVETGLFGQLSDLRLGAALQRNKVMRSRDVETHKCSHHTKTNRNQNQNENKTKYNAQNGQFLPGTCTARPGQAGTKPACPEPNLHGRNQAQTYQAQTLTMRPYLEGARG